MAVALIGPLIGGGIGGAANLGAAEINKNPGYSFSCTNAIQNAYEIAKESIGGPVTIDGPEETKCHVNERVRQMLGLK
ncbi:hypothetical protein AHiyo8_00920 [Arthrobacter sp. Hiyo8]|nr:hypothetical protein AHiyo8_00920 [Arthrobacter sp. Hiyo8]GAP61285.1 hypothetical protein AHiyo1_49710 [Arthrobacter sp. Hiyo1]